MRLLPLALALTAAVPLTATVLTFDITGMTDYADIPAAYGDNVTSTANGSFSYGMGNAFTPNITVDYATINSAGGVVASNLEWWNLGYGDLQGVAFPVNNSSIAEITLTAAAGFQVRLNTFDLAGYPGADHPNSQVRILDAGGGVLLDYSPVNVQGDANGPRHSTFSPAITAQQLRIRFAYDDWNVAIDNVNFDEVTASASPVPEPSTWLLSAAGLAGLAYRRRK